MEADESTGDGAEQGAERASLAELDRMNKPYRIEGFMWHQGENDMFSAAFKPKYGANLKNFLACWRRDLKAPNLKFYIGELCTKTIWGMDNRENMYAIRAGQNVNAGSGPRPSHVSSPPPPLLAACCCCRILPSSLPSLLLHGHEQVASVRPRPLGHGPRRRSGLPGRR